MLAGLANSQKALTGSMSTTQPDTGCTPPGPNNAYNSGTLVGRHRSATHVETQLVVGLFTDIDASFAHTRLVG